MTGTGDTAFYSLERCKEELDLDETTDDDATLNKFGVSATVNTQNFLISIFGAGNVPTGTSVTQDMKDRTNYLVCKMFKGKIKEYKAKDNFKELAKMAEDNIKLLGKATPKSSYEAAVYSQAYRTSPLKDR